MKTLNVIIEDKIAEIKLYGHWIKSNDKTISKDIPLLSKKYYKSIQKAKCKVLPFFVLSRNYNENTKDFELFIGSILEDKKLEEFILPKGTYAKITIKPKLGFIWGTAIGEAKNYFYTKWLPSNNYKAVNMEYEYHTEKSIGKSPTIDIIFAIEGL